MPHLSRICMPQQSLQPAEKKKNGSWFLTPSIQRERKPGLGIQMKLFAMESFLGRCSFSLSLDLGLKLTRTASIMKRWVFPNKPWTVSQTSDLDAFPRLCSPKLGFRSIDKNIKLQGSMDAWVPRECHIDWWRPLLATSLIAPKMILWHFQRAPHCAIYVLVHRTNTFTLQASPPPSSWTKNRNVCATLSFATFVFS